MKRRGFHGLVLATLALSLTAAGCKKSDTILFVTVAAGDPSIALAFQFRVTVTAGLDTRAILVPETLNPASAIRLPTSFTISIDRSHGGPITVTIDAFDQDGFTIAAGTTTKAHPVIGGQTVIEVTLLPTSAPTGPDAGAAGMGGGAGVGGGGMGGSGGAGMGGNAGQDGAAGTDAAEAGAPDAPQDAADAQGPIDGMGLDTAAD